MSETVKYSSMTAEELRKELGKKLDAVEYLRMVSSRRHNHMGQVKWTAGGRRMLANWNAEIAEIRARLGGVQA